MLAFACYDYRATYETLGDAFILHGNVFSRWTRAMRARLMADIERFQTMGGRRRVALVAYFLDEPPKIARFARQVGFADWQEATAHDGRRVLLLKRD